MKKVSTIVIALLLAVSGMHFTIAAHYCQGNLSKTIISLNGKTADCGMEHSRSASHVPVFSRECCDDRITVYTVDNDYSPSFISLLLAPAVTAVPVQYITDLLSFSLKKRPENPPGYDLITSVDSAAICVLRI
ncbi:MAG TPA: hypothetical protein VK179_06670 [Bacteroidales bacterium]|nr:hypothetical protein [Bacteroidales bacterium]